MIYNFLRVQKYTFFSFLQNKKTADLSVRRFLINRRIG